MIAALTFGRPDARGVRRASFVPTPGIPLAAACVVANGVREALREFVGVCDATLGEPVSLEPEAWTALALGSHCFLVRGRLTDIVIVLAPRDARALVRTAFGESESLGAGAFSALEHQAMERIVARCAGALDSLCAERRGPVRALAAGELPACVAYFDIRVHGTAAFDLGIGIVRRLPEAGPGGRFGAGALARVPVEVRAEFGAGTLAASQFLAMRVGDTVRLDTKVGSAGTLKAGGRSIAHGMPGERGARRAFAVDDLAIQGVWPA